VVEPPRTEQDPDGGWREWIARTFLPPNLAPFFLSDGQAASAYAERDMGAQVKEGIDGLLGLVWLRRLAQSLRDYAANRRGQVAKGADAATILRLEAEVKQLDVQVAGAEMRLKEIETELAGLDSERLTLTRKLAGTGGRTRAELARLIQTLDQTKRPARLAKRAEEIALMLDDLLRDARPLQSREIADEMTRAIGAMAHKKDLFRRVEITEDGEVRLLGPGGHNLRDYDLSAGEKQVFTQALFAAVAAVSQRIFPLVIDTPLGRLDEEHRIGVLRFLAERPSQVILISTDTEVVGPYLDAVRDRVAGAWLLRNTTEGDSGRSWVERGYFPGQGLSP
jgi:DNA sulfur modification protein DndD